MKNNITKIFILFFILTGSAVFAQSDPEEKKHVNAGCSKCVFHSSKKCSLAVEIDGKIYEVEGSSLKDHGKPRAKDGLCKVAREAEVSGKIESGKFIAFEFNLLPMQKDQLPLMDVNDSQDI